MLEDIMYPPIDMVEFDKKDFKTDIKMHNALKDLQETVINEILTL